MDENLRNVLGNEIMAEILGLDQLEVGSEEKARAIEGVCKLCKVALDDVKNANEAEVAFAKANNEAVALEQKTEVEKHSKVKEWVKLGIEGAAIVIPAAVSLIFMKKGFQFEETGSYTSGTFRNMFGLFKPKK